MSEEQQHGMPEQGQQGQPSEDELRAALEEQMRKIKVSDVLLQTAVTLVNIGARRLGIAGDADAEPRDLDQSKLAIDGVRALLPLLPDEQAAPVKDALSQLQMAYAKEAGSPDTGQDVSPTQQKQQPAGEQPAPDEAEREKARSKLWTPPGT